MKKIICLLLLAVMLVSVAGCAAAGDEWETTKKSAERLGDQLDDAQIRKMSQMILDAIITEDMDMAYSLITADMTKEDFTAAYQDMRLVLDGVDTYELLAYNKHVNTVVGSKQVVQIQYMLTAEGRRILLNVAWDSSTPDGLVGRISARDGEIHQSGIHRTIPQPHSGRSGRRPAHRPVHSGSRPLRPQGVRGIHGTGHGLFRIDDPRLRHVRGHHSPSGAVQSLSAPN